MKNEVQRTAVVMAEAANVACFSEPGKILAVGCVLISTCAAICLGGSKVAIVLEGVQRYFDHHVLI